MSLSRQLHARCCVIVPAYGRADLLHEAIASLYGQTDTDWQLLVIDDGSADPLEPVVRQRWPDTGRILVYRQENGGAGAARNTGLSIVQASASKYAAMLDSDDMWAPDKLSVQMTILDTSPDLSAVMTGRQIIDNALSYADWAGPTSVSSAATYSVNLSAFLKDGFLCPPASIVLRTSAVKDFRYARDRCGEDVAAFLGLLAAGHGLTYVKSPLYLERRLPGSLQRQNRSVYDGAHAYLRALEAHGQTLHADPALEALALQARDRQISTLLWAARQGVPDVDLAAETQRWLPQISDRQRRLHEWLKTGIVRIMRAGF